MKERKLDNTCNAYLCLTAIKLSTRIRTLVTEGKILPTPIHPLKASSEPRPSRTLELVQASKS